MRPDLPLQLILDLRDRGEISAQFLARDLTLQERPPSRRF